jgi:tripartite-type tricarboxylate transporter receptor subunit TctC
MLADAAGVKISPVPYRASNQSIQDLICGQIKLACDNFAVAYGRRSWLSSRYRAVSETPHYGITRWKPIPPLAQANHMRSPVVVVTVAEMSQPLSTASRQIGLAQ